MHKDLLTGSNTGFIGRQLAKKLKRNRSKLKLLRQDEWLELGKILKLFSPDRIFHLASFGNHNFQKNLEQILDVNIFKTFQLLSATRGLKISSFVLLGSSSEYGKKNEPMKETDLLEPETFYGASKAAATLLAQVWAKNFRQPVVIIRPFSIYGPGEADHRFIPTVIRSCLLKEPMDLDPNAVHDWLYVSDLIDGILLFSDKASDLIAQVINLGSGTQTTNKEIVETIEMICGKKANIRNIGKTRYYDKVTWVADISLAKSLGWKPKTSLFKGLFKTVKRYEQALFLRK